MTAAIVTCDQCQEPIDGYTFGRRQMEPAHPLYLPKDLLPLRWTLGQP